MRMSEKQKFAGLLTVAGVGVLGACFVLFVAGCDGPNGYLPPEDICIYEGVEECCADCDEGSAYRRGYTAGQLDVDCKPFCRLRDDADSDSEGHKHRHGKGHREHGNGHGYGHSK